MRRTMGWAAIAAAIVLANTGVAQAQAAPDPQKLEMARQIMLANGGVEGMQIQLKAMFASIDKLVTSALSSSSGGAAVGQSMMKYFQDEELKAVPSLIDDTAQIYAEHLTTRELSDMLAWSRSPSAQSIREKLPAISSEAMQRQQPLIKKLMAGAMKTAVDRACEENPCTADQRQTMAMMLERFAPAS